MPTGAARRKDRGQFVNAVLPAAFDRPFVLVRPFALHHRFARDPALETQALAHDGFDQRWSTIGFAE